MRTILPLIAVSALAAAAAPSISVAAPWQNINQRQAQIDQRIDAGVRNGDLTQLEAKKLRNEFQQLARLESHYRRDGLTAQERADLDRRFDGLSARVRWERNDSQERDKQDNGPNINQRQAQIDQRIDAGVRNGDLTQLEAKKLRNEFQQLARLESHYRRDGLTAQERADLSRRFDALSTRVRYERNDVQERDNGPNINQRQAELDRRIDAGVRNGDLTRGEAQRLRDDFRDLQRLEAQYRRGGLDARERRDLDQRFDSLSARVRYERNDRQERDNAQNLNQRQRMLDARIDAGVRNGTITRAEAIRLRNDFRNLERLEAQYRRGGLNAWERRDLDRRLDLLSTRIRWERRDRDSYRRW